MIVDFQHHYTPPELMERGTGDGNVGLDENGNPNYRFNPLLADLPAHVRMMDKACMSVTVFSSHSRFDQPSLATCQLINNQMLAGLENRIIPAASSEPRTSQR